MHVPTLLSDFYSFPLAIAFSVVTWDVASSWQDASRSEDAILKKSMMVSTII